MKQTSRTEMDKTPPRIMMVVDGFYPGIGGAEAQVELLSQVLTEGGHRVVIVAPRLDPTRPEREIIAGIPVERISYPHVRLLGALILVAKFAWMLWCTRRDYDAIHIHMAKNLAAAAGLVKPLLRATVMVKISGAWEFDGGILDPALKRHPLMWFMNFCIRRVDYIQCISGFTRKMLLNAGYPERMIRMIPNGVDVARYGTMTAHVNEAPPIVVYVGRLQPVKGLDVLIGAWKEVRRRHAALLVIAGDGPEKERLMHLARTHSLSDSIVFPGHITTIPDLLCRAAIYVQPSYQEGLPNSVLEAMTASLPIVATRVSGNEDLVQDRLNGRLVAPGDVAELAQALDELLADPSRSREMGRRSRRLIEETYQVPVVASMLSRAYRRVV